MTPILECRDLCKSYGNIQALEHINFTVEPGKIAALTFKGDFFSASEPDELAAHFVGCTPDRAGYEKALGDVDVSRYFAGLQKDELIDILCEG